MPTTFGNWFRFVAYVLLGVPASVLLVLFVGGRIRNVPAAPTVVNLPFVALQFATFEDHQSWEAGLTSLMLGGWLAAGLVLCITLVSMGRRTPLIVGEVATLRFMSQRTRWLSFAGAGVLFWFVLVVGMWAIRPLSDTVPVGVNADRVPVTQKVRCNTLFENSARDNTPLPTLAVSKVPLPKDVQELAYTRSACGEVHRQAQIIFGVNTLLTIVALAAIGAVAGRGRRRDETDHLLAA